MDLAAQNIWQKPAKLCLVERDDGKYKRSCRFEQTAATVLVRHTTD